MTTKQCLTCQATTITEVIKDNQTYYYCQQCQELYERAIDFRYGRDILVNSPDGITHIIAGGLIEYQNKYLLIKRRGYPFGYAFPVGHVEYNETPIQAFEREIFEETRLTINLQKTQLIYHELVAHDQCRYGAENHIWYFYKCTDFIGEPIVNLESETVGWYSLEDIQKLPLVPTTQNLVSLLFSQSYERKN